MDVLDVAMRKMAGDNQPFRIQIPVQLIDRPAAGGTGMQPDGATVSVQGLPAATSLGGGVGG